MNYFLKIQAILLLFFFLLILFLLTSNINKFFKKESANSIVYVYNENDFPKARKNIITLKDKTTYILTNTVMTNNQFEILSGGNVEIKGALFGHALISTFKGAMFKSDSLAGLSLSSLLLSAPNGNIYDITSDFEEAFILVDKVKFFDSKGLGEVRKVNYYNLSGLYNDIGDGLIFEDNDSISFLNFTCSEWKNNDAVFFTIKGTVNEVLEFRGGSFFLKENQYAFNIHKEMSSLADIITANTFTVQHSNQIFSPGSQNRGDINFLNNIIIYQNLDIVKN